MTAVTQQNISTLKSEVVLKNNFNLIVSSRVCLPAFNNCGSVFRSLSELYLVSGMFGKVTSLFKNFLLCVFIGAFYFTLGNLPAKYRSRLTSMHLLALVKSNLISECGMDAVMEPFIQVLEISKILDL